MAIVQRGSIVEQTLAWIVPLLLLLLLLLDQCRPVVSQTCEMKSSCSCTMSDGSGTIDLSVLASRDGTPKFLDYSSIDKSRYSYNPCEDFIEGPTELECGKGVAVCQRMGDNGYFDVGVQENSKILGIPGTSLRIVYTSNNGKKTSTVNLKCSSKVDGKFDANPGESPQNNYNFTLTTKHACLPTSGLSAGSVLDIIFFVLLFVYFIAGFLYLYFARGARGKEAIPNYEFWVELPPLIRDGMLFAVKGCKTEDSYERI